MRVTSSAAQEQEAALRQLSQSIDVESAASVAQLKQRLDAEHRALVVAAERGAATKHEESMEKLRQSIEVRSLQRPEIRLAPARSMHGMSHGLR